jgi:hypothetical protein
MDDDNLEEEVDDLIQQLKKSNKDVKKIHDREEFSLKKEDLEQFILDRAGKLINDSIEMVGNVKQYVDAAPNAEDVESLASLLKATTSSIDSLSKILIQDKRAEASLTVKKLDIDSKKDLLETDHQNKLELTREEVLDKLMNDAKIIDITEPTQELGHNDDIS